MDAKTADRLAARRIVAGFAGTDFSEDLRRMVQRVGIGGVILFARNVESADQVARLTGELIGHTEEMSPLIISVDQEGGPVRRFREGFTEFPAMGTLGAIDDVELTRRVAEVTATELKAVGVNLDYAPVVDVNTNPDNPVIGVRSFGDEPARVSRHAIAFIEGLQGAGVMGCAKHFPGHGDTTTDSHDALPSVDHDRERVEEIELAPFYQATAANVATIMTAHVMFPAYDDLRPATMSPVLLQDVLRDMIGFQGVCVTDDLEMKAITKGWSIEDAAVASIAAGADLVLICHSADKQEAAVEHIARALKDHELDEQQFRLGHQRIEDLKTRYLVDNYTRPNLVQLRELLDTDEHRSVAEDVENRAKQATEMLAESTNSGGGGGASTSGQT